MTRKQRLSASVDSQLLKAGQAAVASGSAESLSAWVNDALGMKADHDRRMKALDEFISTYETEFGPITDHEMNEVSRRFRAGAIVVRGTPAGDARPDHPGSGAA